MNYFIPAWHKQLIDWAYSQPSIEFDDAISHLRIFQDNQDPVGVILTDYQPQMTTKLNEWALFPNRVWSVFDYLQGINTLDSQVVDIQDLNWPAGAYFDFTNYRIFVIFKEKLYATIIFDVHGKILEVSYQNGELNGSRLLFDSRGFVSQETRGDEETYFDPEGNWRFKHNRQTDEVTVNQTIVGSSHKIYKHLKDLVEEVVSNQFLPRINANDNLVVTVDDDATVDLVNTFKDYRPIYSISRWNPYEKTLPALSDKRIIVDTAESEQQVKKTVGDPKQLAVMPLFQSQFKLGHSQRVAEQRVAIFAEYMTDSELMTMLERLYPRFLKNPTENALYLYSYSGEKAGMVNQVFNEFRKKHHGEFVLSLDEIDPGENQIDADKIPPILKIKQERFVSNAQVLTALDKIRLMIMWGKPDEFMSIATVSVGIPVLQNFESSEVVDHQNGMICNNWDDFDNGVKYYLDSLKHWNESLVYNVQVLNKYSKENLLNSWQNYLKGDEH